MADSGLQAEALRWDSVTDTRVYAIVLGYHGPHPEASGHTRTPIPNWWCLSEYAFEEEPRGPGIEVGYRLAEPVHLDGRDKPRMFIDGVSRQLLEVWGPNATLLTVCRSPYVALAERPLNTPRAEPWTLRDLSRHASLELRKQRGGWTREQQVAGGMSKSRKKIEAVTKTLESVNSAKKIQHTERAARIMAYRSSGKSFAEIAELENCTPAAASETVRRFKKKLADS